MEKTLLSWKNHFFLHAMLCHFCCRVCTCVQPMTGPQPPAEHVQLLKPGPQSSQHRSSLPPALATFLPARRGFGALRSTLRKCRGHTAPPPPHPFWADLSHSLIRAITPPAHFWFCLPCPGAPPTQPAVNLHQWLSVSSRPHQLPGPFVHEGGGIRL